MKILLSKEEIENHVAFGVEYLQEVSAPEGQIWRCTVFHDDDGNLVAECELAETKPTNPKGA